MRISKIAGALATMALTLGIGSAQAALQNFTLTGEVVYADVPNDYNLGGGSLITVAGIFDDSVLTGVTGTVGFGSGNPYGNMLTVTAGGITFTPNEDITGGIYPILTLNSMEIDFVNNGLDFIATDSVTGATFNSYFNVFDGDDANLNFISGNWTSYSISPAAVPVPAAAWLFGSGLLGLVGIARQRKVA